ncbi:hypothetical protein [Glutamicibacter arilaitensis]|uniref:hypothetical protein n=1 Tax=Glutamicibacter arilaitensis TaxID=256701 RepID=UPI003F8DF477
MERMKLDENQNGTFQVITVAPRVDREKVQRTDRDGLPQWTVETLRRPVDGSPAEVIAVRVAAATQPQIAPMAEVRFKNLEAYFWNMETRSGISLSADEVVPVASGGRSSEAKSE